MRVRLALVTTALVLAGCTAAPHAAPLPHVIAVVGDSISRAVDADHLGATPTSAWATGMDPNDNVTSFAERLQALQLGVNVTAYNDAVAGATMADLAGQADDAVAQHADLVLVLMGANDACAREGMTSVDDYRAQFDLAARTLQSAHATVYVLSLPDLYGLWALEHGDPAAQRTWDALGLCTRLLSSNATDASRAELHDRVAAYDAALREESARYGFAFDDGALANATFARADVSPIDHYHPSILGQARLADLAWNASAYAQLRTG